MRRWAPRSFSLGVSAHLDAIRAVAASVVMMEHLRAQLHFPVLLLLRAWIVPAQRWQPDAPHLLFGMALGALTLTYALAISLLTERRTQVLRRWARSLTWVQAYRHSGS